MHSGGGLVVAWTDDDAGLKELGAWNRSGRRTNLPACMIARVRKNPNRRTIAPSVAIQHGERVRTEVRTAPPTPQPQPFSVGVFSCQRARNTANRLGFLRATADLPCRPPAPPWGLLHSLPARFLSHPRSRPRPEVRKGEKFSCFKSVDYARTNRGGFFAALGSGGNRVPFSNRPLGAGETPGGAA